MLVIPRHDNICNVKAVPPVARDAAKAEVVELDGGTCIVILDLTSNASLIQAGHFDVYPGGSVYDAALIAQVTFLRKHVPI